VLMRTTLPSISEVASGKVLMLLQDGSLANRLSALLYRSLARATEPRRLL
jgi:hypothetical protein